MTAACRQSPRCRPILAAALFAVLALPRGASAQTRLSVGAGAGIAGSTDASLSEGRGGVVLTGQLVHGVLPFVGIGAEVNHWLRSGSSITIGTAIVQVHVPLTGLFLKAGAGYGGGTPDSVAHVSGVAGELGAAYDLTLPGAPIAITVFGNAGLVYNSSRSLQMVGGGLAVTFR